FIPQMLQTMGKGIAQGLGHCQIEGTIWRPAGPGLPQLLHRTCQGRPAVQLRQHMKLRFAMAYKQRCDLARPVVPQVIQGEAAARSLDVLDDAAGQRPIVKVARPGTRKLHQSFLKPGVRQTAMRSQVSWRQTLVEVDFRTDGKYRKFPRMLRDLQEGEPVER